MYVHDPTVERLYKGYRLGGSAESVHNDSKSWFAVGM
jgi:hypothetical protein